MTTELKRRFANPQATPEKVDAFEQVRLKALAFAEMIETLAPPGRERANAITAVEQAVMWANAGISRQSAEAPRDLAMRPDLSR